MRWSVIVSFAAIVACGPKADVDDGGDGATTEGEASSAAGTAADDGADDRPNPSAGAEDAGDGGSGGGATPACVENPESGCGEFCSRLVECGRADDVERCANDCVNELRAGEPPCLAAQCDLFACVGGLECDVVDSDACVAQEAAIDDACSDAATCSIGIGEEGACSYTCGANALTCRSDKCACTEDGKEVGVCDAPGSCTDLDHLEVIADACCGF